MDLLPYVPFRKEVFDQDIRRLNNHAPVLELSVTSGAGLDAWLDWLRDGLRKKRA